ncbi:hypothetical protein INR49_002784 [Caranx melampygus]|nr:hypothetical protein INR49_002784 [Caranx melampygus]
MVKCVVSGCPNRMVNVNRGIFNRPPKRFFNFPKTRPELRETDKQDPTDQHLICEDHFLPEDISANGVSSDAIPIMPPYLDGPLSLISPWGAESSEEEDEDEDEEEKDQWETRGCNNKVRLAPKPAAPVPPQQGPARNLKNPSEPEKTSAAVSQKKDTTQANKAKKISRQDVSLGLLTRGFLKLLMAAPDDSVDLREVAVSLRTRKRRVYDITNVLDGISLIQKESANKIKWMESPISSFLWTGHKRIQKELINLKLVEDTLDSLIKSCAQQLFEMTDDVENSAYPLTPDRAVSSCSSRRTLRFM